MVRKVILSVKKLVRTYGEGKVRTEAVKGVSFDIHEGEFVSLSGPSGSGKSTIFHQISLLDFPTSGKINICGESVINLGEDERADFRLKKIGYVFQHYELLPEMTAFENICLPLMVDKGKTREVFEMADKMLIEMNLIERKNHYPNELSGGEQQRISIARALVNNPRIVLADEPTANLDSVASKKIMNILKDLSRKKKITVFVINHEREFEKYFDRIIRMKDGKIDKVDKRRSK